MWNNNPHFEVKNGENFTLGRQPHITCMWNNKLGLEVESNRQYNMHAHV